ncbi:CLUMA_CG021416, isoform A [Clunio marinus]|uniref:CLUMA_CG021416, isoform A n=1 Tax=Clunio marinus TaxID=568069 RepID=A0A1J1J8V0_9DIPT|nr:CLUMA_CG021416, isoform A [Clunio marinus]
MPRKNKRKIFGKSNKNKSVKWNRDVSSTETQQKIEQHEDDDSEENCDNIDNASGKNEDDVEIKDELIAGNSLNVYDSPPAMGQIESVATNINSNTVTKEVENQQQHKATITLKVIQFIGEIPNVSTDNDEPTLEAKKALSEESNQIKNDETLKNETFVIENVVTVIKEKELPHSKCDVFGNVPKLDENKEDKILRSFDDNYRVESPKQSWIEDDPNEQRNKRHAMLIQEISESSSSEEVKQFLDNEASALEMKTDASRGKIYRVDSPESSDDNNNNIIMLCQDNVTVHEISESSSSESVKNEILASISKSPPPQKACLKIINIKELPSEDSKSSTSTPSKISITQFECRAEKKLNKAEEAILENLYGNKNLLQIPNLPLDVISEEGSDCGSDIDKQASNKAIADELDDEVFLPCSSLDSSKKPPPSSRRQLLQARRGEAEQPLLINTKIIETELNIPEGCKSWETTPIDSELQAELVYLTSTSSSATDLSERGDISDTDEVEDTSEDTETNSLLENISVPSLDNIESIIDMPIEMKNLRQSPIFSSDFYQEINEQKLPDILEEDEEQAPKSLEIIESQKQIEDVNKELHQLSTEHEEMQTKRKKTEVEEKVVIEEDTTTEMVVPETISDILKDKKNNSTDNDKEQRITPTLFKRKSSTDSSSSANSQCTIIRQNSGANEQQTQLVDPLADLCMQSLHKSGIMLNDINEAKIIIQKKHNSSSRNAPQIPVINELELHYECDKKVNEGCENNKEKVITILQVPPEINSSSSSSPSPEKQRWLGLQSSQIPNLLVALSPLQKSYIDTQDSKTNADILLDMHKKFVERRAYHETHDSEIVENSSNSRQMITSTLNESHLESVNQLEDGYFGDRENSVEREPPKSKRNSAEIKENSSEIEVASVVDKCDSKRDEKEHKLTVKSAENAISMNSIRNLLLREEFFKDSFNKIKQIDNSSSDNNNGGFAVKKSELEKELKQLDDERRELEEELKNLYSLQHFKREELLFNEKKLEEKKKPEDENRLSFASSKHSNDDFNEFVNSNEKLHQELYNEWQDKVLERYERKLQKTIKLTSIKDSIHRHDDPLERASSEILRFVPLESEFMTKLKERQKRLSLPIQTEHNSSTESLHHQNEEIEKTNSAPTIPAHLHEFLKYYEEEIAQSKHSDESGESKQTLSKPLIIGLIGLSMCLCGYLIGKYLITQKPKLF